MTALMLDILGLPAAFHALLLDLDYVDWPWCTCMLPIMMNCHDHGHWLFLQ